MYNKIGKNDVIFSDLPAQCKPQACFSDTLSADKWKTTTYKTAKVSGTMISAEMSVTPPPLALSPELTGWHRIYVCLFAGVVGRTYISLRLSADRAPSFFSIGNMYDGVNNGSYWSDREQCEESFWKCADMTGQMLTIAKSAAQFQSEATLMWVRFVPMTDGEVAAELADRARKDVKRLHAHSDMEWPTFSAPETVDEYAAMIEEYALADVELISAEVSIVKSPYQQKPDINIELLPEWPRCKWHVLKALGERYDEIYTELIKRAHEYGMKMLATFRCGISPNPFTLGDQDFVHQNPQLYCRDRDGEEVAFMSYAYQSTRDYIIDGFLHKAAMGFDGASLIFTRGIFVLFEQPVLDEFAARFGTDIDPRTLPFQDERLAAVRCDVMTDFMRSLRRALDEFSAEHKREKMMINAFVCYTLFDSKLMGLDVEAWAREGLIDCVVPSNMMTFEILDGMWDENNPARIDLSKYAHGKIENPYSPIQRMYGNSMEKMAENCSDWVRMAKLYNIKVYFEMPWENTTAPEVIRDYAEKLYSRGAENLSLWDCYIGRVQYRPEWQITSKLGHRDELRLMPRENSGYRSLYRILSLGGHSLAAYNPEWCG